MIDPMDQSIMVKKQVLVYYSIFELSSLVRQCYTLGYI